MLEIPSERMFFCGGVSACLLLYALSSIALRAVLKLMLVIALMAPESFLARLQKNGIIDRLIDRLVCYNNNCTYSAWGTGILVVYCGLDQQSGIRYFTVHLRFSGWRIMVGYEFDARDAYAVHTDNDFRTERALMVKYWRNKVAKPGTVI